MKASIKIYMLLTLSVLSVAFIVALFLWSERITHYENRFIRRYPPHVAQKDKQFDLKLNSYYFAGISNGKIYLGNTTAPLLITVIDTSLSENLETFKIELNRTDLPFRTPEIRVSANNFFVYEGVAPYLFKGTTNDWKAKFALGSGSRFTQVTPIDSTKLAVRFSKRTSVLGTINLSDTLNPKTATNLLEKQIDGIIDTDGYLLFDESTNRIVYLYRYRNQYLVADTNLNLAYRGNTIDTISKANIKLAKVSNRNMTTYSEPPLVVNRLAAVNDGKLFVNSNLPGKFEKDNLWRKAAIIDVYDLSDNSYQSSFPIYNINDEKVKGFIVSNNKLFALIGNHLVSYSLLDHLTVSKKKNN